MIMFTEAGLETPEKVKVNRWEDPEPEAGLTLSGDPAVVTVQEPIFCQGVC